LEDRVRPLVRLEREQHLVEHDLVDSHRDESGIGRGGELDDKSHSRHTSRDSPLWMKRHAFGTPVVSAV